MSLQIACGSLDLRIRVGALHAYACRGEFGYMRPKPPDQSRQALFCHGCAYIYRKSGCLFEVPERKRESEGE